MVYDTFSHGIFHWRAIFHEKDMKVDSEDGREIMSLKEMLFIFILNQAVV